MLVGLERLELSTSRLSGVRSNHLSYRPVSAWSFCFRLRQARRCLGHVCLDTLPSPTARLPCRKQKSRRGKAFSSGCVRLDVASVTYVLIGSRRRLLALLAGNKNPGAERRFLPAVSRWRTGHLCPDTLPSPTARLPCRKQKSRRGKALSSGHKEPSHTSASHPHVAPVSPPSPHQKLWWSWSGSNRRPPACKADALPAELQPQAISRFSKSLVAH